MSESRYRLAGLDLWVRVLMHTVGGSGDGLMEMRPDLLESGVVAGGDLEGCGCSADVHGGPGSYDDRTCIHGAQPVIQRTFYAFEDRHTARATDRGVTAGIAKEARADISTDFAQHRVWCRTVTVFRSLLLDAVESP